MTAETTCRFEELDGGVLAVGLRPELNEVPWTDIERIGSGVVLTIASGVALALGLFALVDALLDGAASAASGREVTLWGSVALSVLAAVLGIVAATRAAGTFRVVAIVLTTLAVVAALAAGAAVAGVVDRPEPNLTPAARRAV